MIGIVPAAVICVLFADSLLTGSAQTSHDARLRSLVAGLLLGGRWLLGHHRVRHGS